MTTKATGKRAAPNKKAGIFLIDDHSILRDGLRRLLETEGGFVVCGEAGNAKCAIAEIKKLVPELVIIDISLPGIGGLEAIKTLRAQMPKLRMVVLSMHDESLYAERALRAGAMGYVMKQASPKQLLNAVRTVLKDQIYLNPSMSAHMIQSIVRKKTDRCSDLEALSDRELRILQLIGEGFTTTEIGAKLGISRKTVESHRGNIRQKLGLASGAELTRFALSQRQDS
jgi:DNA-binding NarL/FixJ family response regulator